MPLVRIDLQKGRDAAYRRRAGQIVYEALVSATGVPPNDLFQIIGEHATENFIYDPDYAGIHRTAELIFVQVVFNEGRTIEQKRALYKAIADGLSELLGLQEGRRLRQPDRGQERELVLRERHRPIRSLTAENRAWERAMTMSPASPNVVNKDRFDCTVRNQAGSK